MEKLKTTRDVLFNFIQAELEDSLEQKVLTNSHLLDEQDEIEESLFFEIKLSQSDCPNLVTSSLRKFLIQNKGFIESERKLF